MVLVQGTTGFGRPRRISRVPDRYDVVPSSHHDRPPPGGGLRADVRRWVGAGRADTDQDQRQCPRSVSLHRGARERGPPIASGLRGRRKRLRAGAGKRRLLPARAHPAAAGGHRSDQGVAGSRIGQLDFRHARSAARRPIVAAAGAHHRRDARAHCAGRASMPRSTR